MTWIWVLYVFGLHQNNVIHLNGPVDDSGSGSQHTYRRGLSQTNCCSALCRTAQRPQYRLPADTGRYVKRCKTKMDCEGTRWLQTAQRMKAPTIIQQSQAPQQLKEHTSPPYLQSDYFFSRSIVCEVHTCLRILTGSTPLTALLLFVSLVPSQPLFSHVLWPFKPLSSLSVVCVNMGLGPRTRVWVVSHVQHPWKQTAHQPNKQNISIPPACYQLSMLPQLGVGFPESPLLSSQILSGLTLCREGPQGGR